MIDVNILRKEPQIVRNSLQKRGLDPSVVDHLVGLDEQYRLNETRLGEMRAQKNRVSEQIGRLKKSGEDAAELVSQMKELDEQIVEAQQAVTTYKTQFDELLLGMPNLVHPDTPNGLTEEENEIFKVVGTPTAFTFTPKPHHEIGEELGLFDFEAARRVSGARFVFGRGLGAKLERALSAFMLDIHTSEFGYEEIMAPLLVNSDAMYGTGNFPKFKEDVFAITGEDKYLIPTAEVPVTNLYREQILTESDLPKYFVAHTPCFRSEAGSAGRDTRGLIRMHQFNKVELVKLVKPADSYMEWEKLVDNARIILDRLDLPYRVLDMCAGDVGFGAARKRDIEVWMPGAGQYREISSCSNFEGFQARRAKIRYRDSQSGENEYVHTMNGSALALGRTVAAILENYQEEDGSVRIPWALRPYMNGLEKITKA